MSEATPVSDAQPTVHNDSESQMDQRMKMVRKFQAKAVARSDPLAANLGVILSDLMLIAHIEAVNMQETIAEATTAGKPVPQDERKTDTYLKFARQIERMARVDRELAPPTVEESVARGPRPFTRWRE
jgi:hypothetical protein